MEEPSAATLDCDGSPQRFNRSPALREHLNIAFVIISMSAVNEQRSNKINRVVFEKKERWIKGVGHKSRKVRCEEKGRRKGNDGSERAALLFLWARIGKARVRSRARKKCARHALP